MFEKEDVDFDKNLDKEEVKSFLDDTDEISDDLNVGKSIPKDNHVLQGNVEDNEDTDPVDVEKENNVQTVFFFHLRFILFVLVESFSPFLSVLLEKQSKHFDRIFEELKVHGEKKSCWMWWVFPTNQPGNSEPDPKSCLPTPLDVENYLQHVDGQWINILREIILLSIAQRRLVIPDQDVGRLISFVSFWEGVENTPRELNEVLRLLTYLIDNDFVIVLSCLKELILSKNFEDAARKSVEEAKDKEMEDLFGVD